MRSTLMYPAGDVPVENVPDAKPGQAETRIRGKAQKGGLVDSK